MSVAGLFLRTFDTRTYPGWIVLEGYGWQQADEMATQRLNEMFAKHVPSEVDAMYNQWQIIPSREDGKFEARRFTWESFGWYGTLDEIEAKLNKYYTSKAFVIG